MSKNFFEIENVSFAAGGKNKLNNVNYQSKMRVILFAYLVHLVLEKLLYLEQLLA